MSPPPETASSPTSGDSPSSSSLPQSSQSIAPDDIVPSRHASPNLALSPTSQGAGETNRLSNEHRSTTPGACVHAFSPLPENHPDADAPTENQTPAANASPKEEPGAPGLNGSATAGVRRNPKRTASSALMDAPLSDIPIPDNLLEEALAPLTQEELNEWKGWIEFESDPVSLGHFPHRLLEYPSSHLNIFISRPSSILFCATFRSKTSKSQNSLISATWLSYRAYCPWR